MQQLTQADLPKRLQTGYQFTRLNVPLCPSSLHGPVSAAELVAAASPCNNHDHHHGSFQNALTLQITQVSLFPGSNAARESLFSNVQFPQYVRMVNISGSHYSQNLTVTSEFGRPDFICQYPSNGPCFTSACCYRKDERLKYSYLCVCVTPQALNITVEVSNFFIFYSDYTILLCL